MNLIRVIDMARRAGSLGAACALLTAGSGAGSGASAAQAAAASAATNATATVVTQTADQRFWSALHGADYAAYPAALAAVEAALAESPDDPVQNAHLGWLHMWHLAEAGNFSATGRDRAADLHFAGQDFKQAVKLKPDEARYLGFYASALFIDSALAADAAGAQRAEATMQRAIRMWPEFNLFTAGYIHSSDPYGSPGFATAMQRMWSDLDVCVGQRVSREHPEFAQYLSQATTVGPKRACWNSSIAPHNVEGFFLNFGDMLVKQGDVALARAMYANARASTTYSDWQYRDVLERRITDAAANVAIFREPSPSAGSAQLMLQSNFSCMACHRQ